MTALGVAPSVDLSRVEWRVDGRPTGDGNNARCRFVPYLDARDIASLLDEWVGPGGWSDSYETGDISGKVAVWCHLAIKVGDEWVTKTDVGVPSQFESQKGAVSDAFKRAGCLKWGVGRNVYELPTLWAPCRVDAKGNAWPNDKSLPDIAKQLKGLARLGDEGGRVAAVPDGVDAETGEVAAVDVVPASVAKEWLDRMAIEPEAERVALKNRFGNSWGPPSTVPTTKAKAVDAWLDTELAAPYEAPEPPDEEPPF